MVKRLRAQNTIPATIYGKNVEPVTVEFNLFDFNKVYKEVGESTLIYAKVDGERNDRPVLVRSVTRHPVDGSILDVQFNQVNLSEKVTATVKVELIGEAPAEKDGKGILVQLIDELEVEALPAEMPEHLEISVEELIETDQAILVSAIPMSNKFVIKSDPNMIIAKIEPLAVEEKVETKTEEAVATTTEGSAVAPAEKTEEKQS